MSGIIGTSGKRIATRGSYGNALAELGRESEKIVMLDAGLAAATKTGAFRKAFSEHHIDHGVAERNIMGVATGLTVTSMVPLTSSFAIFAVERAFEQVHNSAGYPYLNTGIGATHTGVSMGEDRAIHQCNEGITLMRTIPRMVVVCPFDDIEVKTAVRAAAEYGGPVYLRLGCLTMPVVNDREDCSFTIGKGMILRGGKDVTIVATGLPVSFALETVILPEKDGIDVEAINIHVIKPPDGEFITASARKTGKVVTVEEHSVTGGLGSAVCNVLCDSCPVPVKKTGMQDQSGESDPAVELIHKYGLNGEDIYTQMKEYLGR